MAQPELSRRRLGSLEVSAIGLGCQGLGQNMYGVPQPSRADPEVPVEELAGVIQDLMKQGKVLHWGLCEVSPDTIRRAHKIQPLAAVQSEYSLFFRGREQDVLPVCAELGIGFVPWSPLGMGTLAGYVDDKTRFAADASKDLRGIIPRFTPENMAHNVQLFRLIRKWANRKLCPPAQFSLAWLQAQHDFIVPIPARPKAGTCWKT